MHEVDEVAAREARLRAAFVSFRIKKENGREERIRTSGPCLPKTVLYQAELHSDVLGAGSPPRGEPLYTVRPPSRASGVLDPIGSRASGATVSFSHALCWS